MNGYMISNETLLHRPMINLGWMDDGMSLRGMSEGAPLPTWVTDTGSSPQDMQDHVDTFHANVARLQKETVARGGFYWQMIQGSGPEIRPVVDQQPSTCHKPAARNVTSAQCKATLRTWCVRDPVPWQQAHLYLVCPASHRHGKPQNNGMANPDTAEQATAEFLLTRPAFAWIGYGWNGCSSASNPGFQPRPTQWDADYGGAPAAACTETGRDTGIFERSYPRATVTWDCNTHRGAIRRKVEELAIE